MTLEAFCEETSARDLPRATERIRPERAVIKAISNSIQLRIQDRSFILECISKEISRLHLSQIGRGLQAFHEIEPLGVRLAFGHWAPRANGLGPHTHTAWTVTSVCSNSLEVKTFDRDESCKQKTLVEKNQFTAIKGASGYIYDPSIHQPFNPTSQWTLSLHIVSPFDGEDDPDFDFDIPGLDHGRLNNPNLNIAHARMLSNRIRFGAARNIFENLCQDSSSQARALLTRLYGIAGSRDRKAICNYFQVPDPELSGKRVTIYRPSHDAIKLSVTKELGQSSLTVQIGDEIISKMDIAEDFIPALDWIILHPVFERRDILLRFHPGVVATIVDYLEKWGLYCSESTPLGPTLTDHFISI